MEKRTVPERLLNMLVSIDLPVGETSPISASAATVLATTMGVESERRSFRRSRNPWSSTSWELMSCSLATHTAAVFRT